MSVAQVELEILPQEVEALLARIPLEYVRDLAVDLAWAALVASRRPDALHQVIREWEITLEEIDPAGDDLADILQARREVRADVGMTPGELHTYIDDDAGQ